MKTAAFTPPFSLIMNRIWPRAAIAELFLLLARSTGKRCLAQLGITCQFKALAQREKAEIFFGDAAHMRSDHHAGHTWGKRGATPIVETTGARHRMRA